MQSVQYQQFSMQCVVTVVPRESPVILIYLLTVQIDNTHMLLQTQLRSIAHDYDILPINESQVWFTGHAQQES